MNHGCRFPVRGYPGHAAIGACQCFFLRAVREQRNLAPPARSETLEPVRRNPSHLAGQRHPESGERAPEGDSPEFLEILPGGLSTSRPECMIEFEETDGAKMRIHLQGGDLPDLATLARVFRECR